MAWNDDFAEGWQYLGTILESAEHVRHEFRHRAHTLYDDARVYAHVRDGDTGPSLARLIADGRELPLPGGEVDDLASP